MTAWLNWRQWREALINPQPNPELEEFLQAHRDQLPVLWLLGKTGVGKSSIVQRLTGDSRATIGNGFEPCTRSAFHYDHPATAPVMRFLDTRGLGEAGYNPQEDLDSARQGSHALLVVQRIDDPDMGSLLSALEDLGKALDTLAILQIHTHLHTLSEMDRSRAISQQQQALHRALGRPINSVCIDFTDAEDGFENPDEGLPDLRKALVELVPELSRALTINRAHSDEETLFLLHRREVLGYAGGAAASDLVPALGLVAVPTLQGKMMHALAGRYGIDWTGDRRRQFLAAMGGSFLYRYALSLLGRQLGKLVPVYGQTAGAAAAASISFASTYALGRAVCLFLYRQQQQAAVTTEELHAAFRQAFRDNT